MRRYSHTRDRAGRLEGACRIRAVGLTGFTLIEVLVVVAIIALLIAILIPSLRRAKRQAQIVVAHSDLRQIAVALDAYAMNHKDKFPPTRRACGEGVNYQLPVELANKRYLPKSSSKIPQAEMLDVFDPERTYRYRAPGPGYFNGTFWDDPRLKHLWGTIWVPDDFPGCHSEEGQYYQNAPDEPTSPVSYAVWSLGPDHDSPKFPRDEDTGAIDENRFPVPKRFWLRHGGDTGLITHFRGRTGLMYMSP